MPRRVACNQIKPRLLTRQNNWPQGPARMPQWSSTLPSSRRSRSGKRIRSSQSSERGARRATRSHIRFAEVVGELLIHSGTRPGERSEPGTPPRPHEATGGFSSLRRGGCGGGTFPSPQRPAAPRGRLFNKGGQVTRMGVKTCGDSQDTELIKGTVEGCQRATPPPPCPLDTSTPTPFLLLDGVRRVRRGRLGERARMEGGGGGRRAGGARERGREGG